MKYRREREIRDCEIGVLSHGNKARRGLNGYLTNDPDCVIIIVKLMQ
jgi:hypothetical protein